MRISDTISRLRVKPATHSVGSRLEQLRGFGANPGNLNAFIHRPRGLAGGAPLVVVLHGCTQTAGDYDAGSGWSELADRHGFAVLFPEQQRANNPNLCFNWFVDEDIRRGSGEACSIAQMIAHAVHTLGSDPSRVFITGLSAGGAMTAVMLATYPEMFAAGGIIAGLAYRTATSLPAALGAMRGHGGQRGEEHTDISSWTAHAGPWPRVSIWHGDADHVVAPSNMDLLTDQWRMVHGLDVLPAAIDELDGHTRRRWTDDHGDVVLESVLIAGMGHGTPIAGDGPHACGRAAPHMLDVGVSSTYHLAAFWGLIQASADNAAPSISQHGSRPTDAAVDLKPGPLPDIDVPETGLSKIINDALRSAGLIR